MNDQQYIEQMRQLAEIGASLCCYLPGAGNPDRWAESGCDCKYLPVHPDIVTELGMTTEHTGCCEIRQAWRALDALRERANIRESRVL